MAVFRIRSKFCHSRCKEHIVPLQHFLLAWFVSTVYLSLSFYWRGNGLCRISMAVGFFNLVPDMVWRYYSPTLVLHAQKIRKQRCIFCTKYGMLENIVNTFLKLSFCFLEGRQCESGIMGDKCQDKGEEEEKKRMGIDYRLIIFCAFMQMSRVLQWSVLDRISFTRLRKQRHSKDLIMISWEIVRTKLTSVSIAVSQIMIVLSAFASSFLFLCFLDSLSSQHDYQRAILPEYCQCKLSRSAAPQMCLSFTKPFLIIAFFIYWLYTYIYNDQLWSRKGNIVITLNLPCLCDLSWRKWSVLMQAKYLLYTFSKLQQTKSKNCYILALFSSQSWRVSQKTQYND